MARGLVVLLAGVGLGAMPGAALAQAAADAAPDAAATLPDDGIVVTARRRTENVQDVPLAVSVLDAQTIEGTGSFNVSRLTQLLPSLQFYSTNPRNAAVNIRGLGAPFGLTNDGIEQGVGIYIDQVYNSRVAASTFDFLDVERIEVLRGPQGTLYGKNTSAGAINITTRQPSFDTEARAELSVGNLSFVQAKASVTGPVVADVLAVRLAGSRTRRDGTIFNVVTGRDVNQQDNLGVRGQLLWRASDRLDLVLAGDISRQDPECCAQIYVRTGATQRPLNRQYAALAAAFGYAPPSTDPFDRLTDLDADLNAYQKLGGASLRAEWNVGPGTLTAVSAWRFWSWRPSNDRDFIGLPVTTLSQNPSRQDQYTQELRYAAAVGRVDLVGGLFAFHQTIATDGLQRQGPAASRFLLNPGSVAPGAAGCATPTTAACNPAVLDGLTSFNDIDFANTSIAAFGQLTWRVTDRLRLQPGLRVNHDRKRGSYVATVVTGTGGTMLTADQRGVLAPQSYRPRFADWNLSWDVTASYDLADALLAYATYARSFKSGGINLSGLPLDAAGTPILAAATVKPERVDHVELGLKSRLLDGRATLNLAAFRTSIADYQATVTNGQLGVLRGYLANADKVRVQGVEADLHLRPREWLTFYVSATLTDAEYRRFIDAPCPPELSGGTTLPVVGGQVVGTPAAPGTPGNSLPFCDISGQDLPGVSKWAASYGAEYRVPLRLAAGAEAYVGYDGSARSGFSSNPSPSAYTRIGGYSIANLRAGVRSDEGWDAFVWARNLFAARYFEVLALQPGNTGLVVGQPADPRTYGVTLKTRF